MVQFGDVVDLHAHALLDQPREDLRMQGAAKGPSGELDGQCEPTLEHQLQLWRRGAHHGR